MKEKNVHGSMEKDILEKTYELGELGLVQGPPALQRKL